MKNKNTEQEEEYDMIYLAMLDCIKDENGKIIQDAMRFDGSIYVSEGMWIRPNGEFYFD
jgi:hypothetical protein